MYSDAYDLDIQICDSHHAQSLNHGLSHCDWELIQYPTNDYCQFCEAEEEAYDAQQLSRAENEPIQLTYEDIVMMERGEA